MINISFRSTSKSILSIIIIQYFINIFSRFCNNICLKENSRKIQLRIIKLVNREYLITKTLSYCILMDIWKTKSFSFPPEIGLLPFLLQKTIIIYQTKRNKRIAYTVWLYLVIYIMLIVPKKDLFNEEKCHWMILLLVQIFPSFVRVKI